MRGPRPAVEERYGLPCMRPWRNSSCWGSFSRDRENSRTSFTSCGEGGREGGREGMRREGMRGEGGGGRGGREREERERGREGGHGGD